MTGKALRGAAAIDKGLTLFLGVVEGGDTSLSALSEDAGIPPSTAQRLVAAFVRKGLLARVGRGRYAAGSRLAGIFASRDNRSVLATASRPLLRRLARETGATVHLGVLEGDMMTYLVKEHRGDRAVLSAEESQLEAYCSGIGKMLLSALDDAALEAYLAAGPFVALTENTITEAGALRMELQMTRTRGYAIDNAELEPGLFCLAVPVHGHGGRMLAAVSVSGFSSCLTDLSRLDQLRACARRIGRRFGAP